MLSLKVQSGLAEVFSSHLDIQSLQFSVLIIPLKQSRVHAQVNFTPFLMSL